MTSKEAYGIDTGNITGTCDNCNTPNTRMRPIKSTGQILSSGSRGYFSICYECYPAHKEIRTPRGTFYTPVKKVGT